MARGVGLWGRSRLLWGRSLSVCVGLVAGALLIFGASDAGAAKGVVQTFGQGGPQGGTGPGEFAFASGMAVNQTSGDVYVADADCCSFDTGGQRVLQFSEDGSFIRAWGWGVATGAAALEVCTTTCLRGIQGSGDGQFSLSVDSAGPQVAVDQSDGSVYVADNLNNRVQKFSATGGFLGLVGDSSGDGQLSGPQGTAVDPVSGDLYVADSSNNLVKRFNSTGVYESQIGTPGGGSGDGEFFNPTRVAVDSTGRLYVLDRDNGRVQRFSDAGTFDQIVAFGLVNGPIDLAIDTADDHAYIAGDNSDFSVHGIFEFDADGAAVDVHAANTGIVTSPPFPAGIAVRSSTGRIYASSPNNPKSVLVLDEVPQPTISIDPVSGITATGATLTGLVNPQGPPVASYRFQYSTDGVTWTPVPSEEGVAVGSGTSDVSVSEAVTGLEPNTEYRVRLVATKPFNGANVISPEETFMTATAAPLVRPLAAGSRSDTTAWLGGEVNPQNAATSYFVEYTLASDTGYANGSRVPVVAVDVGSSNQFVTVRQLATGLQPNTEYRLRVVASNDGGTTAGPDRTFVTDEQLPEPPAGRGYEMVSPLDKNGSDVDRNTPADMHSSSGAAASGGAVAYAADGQFAGIGSGAIQGQYRSVRDAATGWSTRGISPPIEADASADAVSPEIWAFSDDLSRAVVGSNAPLTANASLLRGTWGLYAQDYPAGGLSYQLLTAPVGLLPEGDGDPRFFFAGGSSDLSHVVFDSTHQLTADGPASGRGVYEWIDGEVRFVSMLPSGVPAENPKAGSGTGNNSFQNYAGDHFLSDDRQRVYFTAQDALYVREHGATTRLVSASERTGDPSEPRQATLQAAVAADGSKALFTSNQKLTDDATAAGGICLADTPLDQCHVDLYLWDGNAPASQRLTDLTTADSAGGGVPGIVAAADDLSWVYFVGSGALADGAVAGQPNLYAWTAAGGVRHLATLTSGDIPVWSSEYDVLLRQYRDARATKNGDRLLFASRARLTAADNNGLKQLYLFDASGRELTCVSCRKDGNASSGSSWFFYPDDLVTTVRAPYHLPRNLSVDGERVFFETAQGLVDGDSNGKADVYMWSDGQLSLISTGKGGEESEFIDASASGDDVFFTTRERLVGIDLDDQVDVYDARIGGGFAEQQKPLPCIGDDCQGQLVSQPVLPTLTGDSGSGDPPISKRPAFSVKGLSAKSRRALANGRQVVLTVGVNKAGRVTVRGSARVGGKARTVLSASKRARGSDKVRLALRLSKAGRQQLARTGRLRLKLVVRFSGVSEPKALSLSLVGASKSGRGR